jgi:hypothetical protein
MHTLLEVLQRGEEGKNIQEEEHRETPPPRIFRI